MSRKQRRQMLQLRASLRRAGGDAHTPTASLIRETAAGRSSRKEEQMAALERLVSRHIEGRAEQRAAIQRMVDAFDRAADGLVSVVRDAGAVKFWGVYAHREGNGWVGALAPFTEAAWRQEAEGREMVDVHRSTTVYPAPALAIWFYWTALREAFVRAGLRTSVPVRISKYPLSAEMGHDAPAADDLTEVLTDEDVQDLATIEGVPFVTQQEALKLPPQGAQNRPFVPPQVPTGLRSNYRLLRVLSESFSPDVARAWRRLPLVAVHTAGVDLYAAAEQLARDVPDLIYRPWDDVLFDCGWIELPAEIAGAEAPDITGRRADVEPYGQLFVRTTFGPAYVKAIERLSPWMRSDSPEAWGADAPDWGDPRADIVVKRDVLMTEAWYYQPRSGTWLQPFISRYYIQDFRAEPAVLNNVRFPEPETARGIERRERWGRLANHLTGHGPLALAFLAQMPHYLVERQEPRPAASPKQERIERQDAKPWTRAGLRTILLIRPDAAPAPARHGPVGTHASPHPHDRRGGWVTLRHPRYYGYPYGENYVTGEIITVPDTAGGIFYDADGILCAADGAREVRVYRRRDDSWREIVLRRVYRRPAWVGPEGAYEAEDGHVYRVLLEESNTERGTQP